MSRLVGLSIRQPWLDLIIRRKKTIELREWAVMKRGVIALHAAWAIDWKAAALFGYDRPFDLPRGEIVGCAKIVDGLELDRESWYRLVDQHCVIHPLRSGVYAAFLENVERLSNPIRLKGKQYFFSLPDAVIDNINQQLEIR
jgi:ASCH domain-containing protein